jgi:hypothetical protein
MDGIEGLKDSPAGFPTIRYMKGNDYTSYESNRDIDSFVNWIETNMKKKQSGGKRKTKKRKGMRKSRTNSKKRTRKRKYKRQNK